MASENYGQLLKELKEETDKIWLDEPDEIVLIRNGVNLGGGGSHDQNFSVLVHLEAFLMILGPHVLYRLILLSEDEKIDLYAVKETTLTLFKRPFDQFEFLGDLGLLTTRQLGDRFLSEVAELESKDEFRELSGVFLSYFNRVFRWVHGMFPWNLGGAFPQQNQQEVQELAESINRVIARQTA